MLHAAITAVALSCCTTITITAESRTDAEPILVEFAGGSVADYVETISDRFGGDAPSNIVLFPGTEGVVLPPMTFAVGDPGDALAVIAEHPFTTSRGGSIEIELEVIPGPSPVFRLSGHAMEPRGHRNRAVAPSGKDQVDVAVLAVPADRIDAVTRIGGTALDLAGIADRSTFTPFPERGLLLVTSTARGREIVDEIVRWVNRSGEAAREAAPPRPEATDDARSMHELRKELSSVAKARGNASLDPERKEALRIRHHELLDRIRRGS